VGADANGQRYAGSSNGFDTGQNKAADAAGGIRVPRKKGAYAQENLVQQDPDLKKVGAWKRVPWGSSEHDGAGQLSNAGAQVEK
jgi:hypothetical protein